MSSTLSHGTKDEGWRFAPLFTSIVIAIVFVGTWLNHPTRGSWDQLDLLVFRTLNNTLSTGDKWCRFWAFCNWRGFDAVSGLAMLTVIVTGMRKVRWDQPLRPWISLGVAGASILLTQQLVSEVLISGWLRYHRPSPTQILEHTWRLSQLVPDIPCKDTSPFSFPGDHGFVLISLALFVSYWASRETVHWAWWLAGLFALPRLIGGAHWFTDIGVGSGSMALVSMSLLMATPLHDWIVNSLLRMVSAVTLGAAGGSLSAQPSTTGHEPRMPRSGHAVKRQPLTRPTPAQRKAG